MDVNLSVDTPRILYIYIYDTKMWILERSIVGWILITFVGMVTNVLFLGWLNDLAAETIRGAVA